MKILVSETEEYLKFYQSLSREDFNKGFAEDQRTSLQVVVRIRTFGYLQWRYRIRQ